MAKTTTARQKDRHTNNGHSPFPKCHGIPQNSSQYCTNGIERPISLSCHSVCIFVAATAIFLRLRPRAYELKHDGYRLQIHIRNGRVRLYTCPQKLRTSYF
jgi:hypothetical protein